MIPMAMLGDVVVLAFLCVFNWLIDVGRKQRSEA